MRERDEPGDSGPIRIVPMLPHHGPRVLGIYGEGIATGNATFETQVPAWSAWDAGHLPKPRWVAEEDGGASEEEGEGPEEDAEGCGLPGEASEGPGEVLGWAALSPVSGRCVYGGVAEVSVYVAAAGRGRGIGRALLRALVTASEEAGFWTLQAGIFPENEASVRLHLGEGFRVVGRRERIGRLRGEWRDVLLLERRSSAVGGEGAEIPCLSGDGPGTLEPGPARDGCDPPPTTRHD